MYFYPLNVFVSPKVERYCPESSHAADQLTFRFTADLRVFSIRMTQPRLVQKD